MSQAIYSLVYVLVFLAVILLVMGFSAVLFRSRDRAEGINRRLTLLESGMNPEDVYSTLIRTPESPFPEGSALARLHDRFWNYCRQAGVKSSPLVILGYSAISAVVIWLASLLTVRDHDVVAIASGSTIRLAASILLVSVGTWFFLAQKHNKRMKDFEEQMPLALDVINRAIRAGHPVISAVQLAAQEMGDPIGSEFGLTVDETTYGTTFKDALVHFAERTGSADAHFFAVSVSIQNETGGNLAEILQGLALVMRGRQTLAKRVKALSSEGRASATLLSALPPIVITLIFLLHPTFYTSKFSDPIFWPTVLSALVLYVVGWAAIHRITHFKY